MVYFISSIRLESVPFDGHSNLKKTLFPNVLQSKFSLAMLNDINDVENVSRSCHQKQSSRSVL